MALKGSELHPSVNGKFGPLGKPLHDFNPLKGIMIRDYKSIQILATGPTKQSWKCGAATGTRGSMNMGINDKIGIRNQWINSLREPAKTRVLRESVPKEKEVCEKSTKYSIQVTNEKKIWVLKNYGSKSLIKAVLSHGVCSM